MNTELRPIHISDWTIEISTGNNRKPDRITVKNVNVCGYNQVEIAKNSYYIIRALTEHFGAAHKARQLVNEGKVKVISILLTKQMGYGKGAY